MAAANTIFRPTANPARCSAHSPTRRRCCVSRSSARSRWTRLRPRRCRSRDRPLGHCPNRTPSTPRRAAPIPCLWTRSCRSRASPRIPASSRIPMPRIPGNPTSRAFLAAPWTRRLRRAGRPAAAGRTSAGTSFTRWSSSRRHRPARGSTAVSVTATSDTATRSASGRPAACITTRRARPVSRAPRPASASASTPRCRCRSTSRSGRSTARCRRSS